MGRVYCCVVNCANTSVNSKYKFYKFPRGEWTVNQRQKWIAAVNRKNPDGSSWSPKKTDRICSSHFIGNEKSQNQLSPSYVPTIFPDVYHKRKVNGLAALNRKVCKAGSMRGIDGDVATARTTPRSRVALDGIVNVSGTANIAAGYRLRDAVKPRCGPRWKKTSLSGDNYNAVVEALKMSEDKKRLEANLMQDERLRDKKIIKQNIDRRVELGMIAYDEDLEVRRDKLRELLLREEAYLTRELIEDARRQEELRAAQWAARMEETEKQREAARRCLLAEKHLQRFVESSEDLRLAWWRARAQDAKKANLAQIADNEEKRRMELENEAYWHDLQQSYVKAQATTEAEKSSRHAEMERLTAETLRDQMAANSWRRQSEATLKAHGDSFNFGQDEDEADKRAKQRRFREGLEQQLREARDSLEKRCCEEEALDRMTASLDQRSGLDDATRMRDREVRRKEVEAYMENLKEFREAVARREEEADEYARRWATELDAQRCQGQLRAKEDRARLSRELRNAWDRQLEEKYSRQQQEEQLQREIDRDNCDPMKLIEMERARRREKAHAYGRELMAQKSEYEASRARERRLEEELEQRWSERELEERRLARELGSRLRI